MSLEAISSDQLQGTPTSLLDLDLKTCSVHDLFDSTLQLDGPAGATGLVGWFDLHCCQDHPELVLSTAPSAPKTHWLQCWMPFQKALEEDTKLQVQLQLRPQKLAGLPELCVTLRLFSDAATTTAARFFLDRGVVEYGCDLAEPEEPEEPEECQNLPESKRQRVDPVQPDLEAVYFPSDVQELLRLAQQAVKDGPGLG